MLINCPECNMQISTKASFCPHCGAPSSSSVKSEKTSIKNRRRSKRLRLPNGFGQISEIKNSGLRKPFRAMITVGKDDNGKPICKLLKPESYFKTYNEAYEALMEYHKNPYSIENATTFKQLYEKWMTEQVQNKSSYQTINSIQNAWKYCSEISDMRVSEIRVRHLKGCIENGVVVKDGIEQSPTPTIKNRMKSVFNQLMDYAIEYELTDKNYARMFSISNETSKEIRENKVGHISYSEDELTLIRSVSDKNIIAAFILIQCYSGWRPQELLNLKVKNIDLENQTFSGGMKTDAGKNRCIPIHSAICDQIKSLYESALNINSETLFFNVVGSEPRPLSYSVLSRDYTTLLEDLSLNPSHKPHDGRVCFVTMAKKYNVDEYAIKYIVGHSITDITEKVYTKRDMSWLKTEIEKIK